MFGYQRLTAMLGCDDCLPHDAPIIPQIKRSVCDKSLILLPSFLRFVFKDDVKFPRDRFLWTDIFAQTAKVPIFAVPAMVVAILRTVKNRP